MEKNGAENAIEVSTGPVAAASAAAPEPRHLAWRTVPMLVIIASAVLMWFDLPRETVGGLAIVLMLALMAVKVPIGIAMAMPGVLGIWALVGERAAIGQVGRIPLETVSSWSLTVLPMFVFMGMALLGSGLTERIYVAARHWVGWLPGGLAIGTNVAGAGFAALSGSTLGIIYPLARSGIPEMIKAGYHRRLALGSVMKAGTLAHLIPPSLYMVLYAGVAEVPIGQQLLAGIGPGVLLLLMYVVGIVGVCLIRPSLSGGRLSGGSTWSERWQSLAKVWTLPVLLAVVVVGMYSGVFTATEAAAVGAFGATIVALWARRKDRPLASVWDAMLSTVGTMGAIFLLLVGAQLLSRLLSVSGLADAFVGTVTDLELSEVELLLMLAVLYLILGMFMEPVAMMLLTVPIVLPLLAPLGISELWFGVFLCVFMELAVVTPPVGLLTYVVYGLVQDPKVNLGNRITLKDTFLAVLYMIPIPLGLIAIITAVPEIVTWIPSGAAE